MQWLDALWRPVPARGPSVTWKIVKIDGPVTDYIGPKIKFGVVISSDAMLANTQTMLFCPLIDGLDEKEGMPLEIMPWHVEVKMEEDRAGRHARVPFSRILMSTKIVLPITRNEIDADGRSRGWLSKESQKSAASKLKLWFPSYKAMAK